MKKMLLSLIIAVCLLSITVCPVFAKYASDLGIGYQFLSEVNYMLDNGYMSYTEGSKFNASRTVTRGEAALILYRFAGEPAVSQSTKIFSDIPIGSVYYNATCWTKQNNIMNGTSSSSFEPNSKIIKQDLAVVLYRYADYMGYDTDCNITGEKYNEFTDKDEISSYAVDAIKWAVKNNLISGDGNKICPQNEVTRVVTAILFYRFSCHIEGIKFGKDNYSFRGEDDLFGISGGSYGNLRYYIDSYYNGDKDELLSILSSKRANHSAAYFGMAASAMADKLGKLNLSSYQNGEKNVYSLNSPASNENLRDVISFYELVQYIPGEIAFYSSNQLWHAMHNLGSTVEENGLALITYTYLKNGIPHSDAAIAYDDEKSGSSYAFKLYAPSFGEEYTVSLAIASDTSPAYLKYMRNGTTTRRQIVSLQYMRYSSTLDRYDADSRFNDYPYLGADSVVLSPTEIGETYVDPEVNPEYIISNPETYKFFWVDLGESFNITWGGKTLTYNNGTFSGTLVGSAKIQYIANGPDIPSEAIIGVPLQTAGAQT